MAKAAEAAQAKAAAAQPVASGPKDALDREEEAGPLVFNMRGMTMESPEVVGFVKAVGADEYRAHTGAVFFDALDKTLSTVLKFV